MVNIIMKERNNRHNFMANPTHLKTQAYVVHVITLMFNILKLIWSKNCRKQNIRYLLFHQEEKMKDNDVTLHDNS